MPAKYHYQKENGYWQVYVNNLRSTSYHKEEHAQLDVVLSQKYYDVGARFGSLEELKLDIFLEIMMIMRERGIRA